MESTAPYKQPFPTPDEAARAAGVHLSHLFTNAHASGKPILFCSSGGTALTMLAYTIIPKDIRLTVTMLDDRYSTDPTVNNFAKFSATNFYMQAVQHGATVIDTRPKPDESLEDVAERFNDALVSWHNNNPDGITIATMGIGPDGHIVGILPYPEDPRLFDRLFVHTDRFVVGYDAVGKHEHTKRVTTTIPFLHLVHHAVLFAVGEEKHRALDLIITEGEQLAETPATIIKQMKDVRIFTNITSE